MSDSGIGDYYAACEARRRAAWHRFEAAKCRGCRGSGRRAGGRCFECEGRGTAPGITYEKMQRLRDAYEIAANTGD